MICLRPNVGSAENLEVIQRDPRRADKHKYDIIVPACESSEVHQQSVRPH